MVWPTSLHSLRNYIMEQSTSSHPSGFISWILQSHSKLIYFYARLSCYNLCLFVVIAQRFVTFVKGALNVIYFISLMGYFTKSAKPSFVKETFIILQTKLPVYYVILTIYLLSLRFTPEWWTCLPEETKNRSDPVGGHIVSSQERIWDATNWVWAEPSSQWASRWVIKLTNKNNQFLYRALSTVV